MEGPHVLLDPIVTVPLDDSGVIDKPFAMGILLEINDDKANIIIIGNIPVTADCDTIVLVLAFADVAVLLFLDEAQAPEKLLL